MIFGLLTLEPGIASHLFLIFHELDTNGDGKLKFEEVKRLAENRKDGEVLIEVLKSAYRDEI